MADAGKCSEQTIALTRTRGWRRRAAATGQVGGAGRGGREGGVQAASQRQRSRYVTRPDSRKRRGDCELDDLLDLLDLVHKTLLFRFVHKP